MVLFQVAGYFDTGGGRVPDMFSFGIFITREEAIKGLEQVCPEPRSKGYNWILNHCTHSGNGWCAWINEIANIGEMTKNTLRPGGK